VNDKTERQSALIGTYNNQVQAEEVLKALERSGYDIKKLSIVGKDYHMEEHEGSTGVGGLGAVDRVLVNLGLPKASVVKYETLLKSDMYLLIAHGTREEVGKARDIMEQSQVTNTEVVAA
jgi:hypothetical protein